MHGAFVYQRSASLCGRNATFTITLALHEIVRPAEVAPMMVMMRYESEGRVVAVSYPSSPFADSVYDLWDLAICLEYISDIDDTRERVPDTGSDGEYAVGVDWAMRQGLFCAAVFLFARDNRRAAGHRAVELLLPTDNPVGACTAWLVVYALPDAVRSFALELRKIHGDIQAVVTAWYDEHEADVEAD